MLFINEAFDNFIKFQKMTKPWQIQFNDMDWDVTSSVKLRDGSTKILKIGYGNVCLYQNYFKKIELFHWTKEENPLKLKEEIRACKVLCVNGPG